MTAGSSGTPEPARTPDRMAFFGATAFVAMVMPTVTMVFVLAASMQSRPAWAQGSVASPLPVRASVKPLVEQSPRWSELKPAQQAALKPLENEWPVIEANRKQTWLELASRFPTISPAEQARVQDRMAEWVKLTPQQRGAARLRFQELKQLPPEDRQARWNAYQALSPEQKQQLVERAAPAAAHKPAAAARTDPSEPPQRKSNIVPNPDSSARPRSIAPTLIQARPGATTSLVTKRPAPPLHQQAGLPKIAATPDSVNRVTLLPQRGPQSPGALPSAGRTAAPAAAP